MLRDLRKARGLSQGELSRRAGVSDSTLSRWESGKFAPDIPELEAVLGALSATDSERQAVLRTFHAPRAIRRLREITGAAAPPVGGDLLWAMRLRKGWTQTETAANNRHRAGADRALGERRIVAHRRETAHALLALKTPTLPRSPPSLRGPLSQMRRPRPRTAKHGFPILTA